MRWLWGLSPRELVRLLVWRRRVRSGRVGGFWDSEENTVRQLEFQRWTWRGREDR